MAKKKKALKPVARGFAVVSVPKKPAPLEQPDGTTERAGDTSGVQGSDVPTTSVAPPEPDPETLEENALQAIVEKIQDKTEKDIVRSVKVGFLLCRTNKPPETFLSLAGNRARTKIRSNITRAEPGSRDHGPDS
jgi:hypothetical protein